MIETGGAKFVKEGSLFFPVFSTKKDYEHTSILLVPLEEVDASFKEYLRDEVTVLLDSGAYALAAARARDEGCHVSTMFQEPLNTFPGWEEHIETYTREVRELEHRLWGYIEVDLGTFDEKRERRETLHEEGLNPIPVFSVLGDDWDDLDWLLAHYDRIAVGSIARLPRKYKQPIIAEVAKRAEAHQCWVHYLGITPTNFLIHHDLHSSDSIGWVNSTKFGSTYFHYQGGALSVRLEFTDTTDSMRREMALRNVLAFSKGIGFDATA